MNPGTNYWFELKFLNSNRMKKYRALVLFHILPNILTLVESGEPWGIVWLVVGIEKLKFTQEMVTVTLCRRRSSWLEDNEKGALFVYIPVLAWQREQGTPKPLFELSSSIWNLIRLRSGFNECFSFWGPIQVLVLYTGYFQTSKF